ncbi:hypothetical protein ABZ547_15675 [Streptomyces sparsogenes]|uniref:hypothetical protein n=1 Tax=Streptomyces sparsogenes TaxID=67365 RepID=UPI0033D0FF3E
MIKGLQQRGDVHDQRDADLPGVVLQLRQIGEAGRQMLPVLVPPASCAPARHLCHGVHQIVLRAGVVAREEPHAIRAHRIPTRLDTAQASLVDPVPRGGRGLLIVRLCADNWGGYPLADDLFGISGKLLWFELTPLRDAFDIAA